METNLIDGQRYRMSKTGYSFHNYKLTVYFEDENTESGMVSFTERTLKGQQRSHVSLKDVEDKLSEVIAEIHERRPNAVIKSFDVEEHITIVRGHPTEKYVKRQCQACGTVEHTHEEKVNLSERHRGCYKDGNLMKVIE